MTLFACIWIQVYKVDGSLFWSYWGSAMTFKQDVKKLDFKKCSLYCNFTLLYYSLLFLFGCFSVSLIFFGLIGEYNGLQMSYAASHWELLVNTLYADARPSSSSSVAFWAATFQVWFLSPGAWEMWILKGLEHLSSRGSGVPLSSSLCCSRSPQSILWLPVCCRSQITIYINYSTFTLHMPVPSYTPKPVTDYD